jgi:hypothetical protein
MIYLILAEKTQLVKIGYSSNLRFLYTHFSQFQDQSPDTLILIGLLKQIHDRQLWFAPSSVKSLKHPIYHSLRAYHSHADWFRRDPILDEFIEKYGVPLDFNWLEAKKLPVPHSYNEWVLKVEKNYKSGAFVKSLINVKRKSFFTI